MTATDGALTGEDTSDPVDLMEDPTPPAYSHATAIHDMPALYRGETITEGTELTKTEPTAPDLALRSTVWYAENPRRYVRIFDGRQDHHLKETSHE